jgi:hypothetical protein
METAAMRKLFCGLLCGLGLAAATLVSSASSSFAASSAEGATVQAVTGAVFGDQPIWTRVDPFSGMTGYTIPSERIIATCKRWGADQRWWYWVRLDLDDLLGHVPGDATNITHSHLDTCS